MKSGSDRVEEAAKKIFHLFLFSSLIFFFLCCPTFWRDRFLCYCLPPPPPLLLPQEASSSFSSSSFWEVSSFFLSSFFPKAARRKERRRKKGGREGELVQQNFSDSYSFLSRLLLLRLLHVKESGTGEGEKSLKEFLPRFLPFLPAAIADRSWNTPSCCCCCSCCCSC